MFDDSTIQTTNHHSVFLKEKISVTSSDNQKDNDNTVLESSTTTTKVLHLRESLFVGTSELSTQMEAVKINSDRKAITERILPYRMREDNSINSKNFETINNQYEIPSESLLSTIDNTIEPMEETQTLTNHIQTFVNQFLHETIQQNPKPFVINQEDWKTNNTSTQYLILVFSLPFAGYVFVRTDNENLNPQNYRQILSMMLVVILMGSAFVGPLSISSNYWPNAYGEDPNISNSSIGADSFNSNSSNIATGNLSKPISDDLPQIATSAEPVNATSAEPVNATSA
ncbi:MAG: hypothetical protein GWN01_13725, partial [Nitrosopumilaceae archaeon]|nr:hypothetical protein [Nitrosopumilaceae archaeon]NIU01924.1 hypothetical protein [Nitrosopumilaceae archaeon]NIU88328.1 hypothetical protein [Nitrosopumilaceae archaeon]NIV66620.1 hypothetical protein [Nitrosopumilaceae archaeon]NIX62525.1 hypothetical protein [Nitrosopumilaceae archaeon]